MSEEDLVKVSVRVDEGLLYQFRHASELINEAKGGYLTGSIKIDCPENLTLDIEKIVLSLVKDCHGGIHPNVLFVTSNERTSKKESKKGIGVEDFQVELLFSRSKILIKHSYLKHQVIDVSNCWNAETRTLTLGKEKGQLKLSIVKPNQRKPTNELNIEPVLRRKFRDIPGVQDFDALVKDFTSNNNRKHSLFKNHLSASVYLRNYPNPIFGVTPSLIYDRIKYGFDVGKIKPEEISGRDINEIWVAMSHFGGDVSVGFHIQDQSGHVLARPEKYEKIGICFAVVFNPIPNVSGNVLLAVYTLDDGKKVAASETLVPLTILNENPPNGDSKLAKKRKLSDTQNVETKRRHSTSSPSSLSSSGSPSLSSILSKVEGRENGFGSVSNQSISSPQTSPDSGVFETSECNPQYVANQQHTIPVKIEGFDFDIVCVPRCHSTQSQRQPLPTVDQILQALAQVALSSNQKFTPILKQIPAQTQNDHQAFPPMDLVLQVLAQNQNAVRVLNQIPAQYQNSLQNLSQAHNPAQSLLVSTHSQNKVLEQDDQSAAQDQVMSRQDPTLSSSSLFYNDPQAQHQNVQVISEEPPGDIDLQDYDMDLINEIDGLLPLDIESDCVRGYHRRGVRFNVTSSKPIAVAKPGILELRAKDEESFDKPCEIWMKLSCWISVALFGVALLERFYF